MATFDTLAAARDLESAGMAARQAAAALLAGQLGAVRGCSGCLVDREQYRVVACGRLEDPMGAFWIQASSVAAVSAPPDDR